MACTAKESTSTVGPADPWREASQHTELVRAPRHDKKDREQKKQDPHGQRCGENELRASVADWTKFLAPPTALR
jgi:hypothetical protein